MSFLSNNPPASTNFGTPQASGFGATPATGFGATATPNFGLGSGAFGTPTSTAGFGGSLFGTSQPSAFSGFGAKTPGTDFSFNTPTFGFGSSQPSGFGATTQQPGFGGVAQPAGFGATSQPSQFGGTPGTGFGLGQTSFGTQPTSGFGGSLFGTSQPSAFSGFGAKPPTTGFSFTPSTFGQPQQQPQQLQQQSLQPQQPQVDESHAFYQSIFQCNKFADERDAILASLNYIQACWGRGKGFYSQTFPPVTYTPVNPFCRFKAVGYSFIYTDSNEDGQVILNVKKSPEKVRTEEIQMISSLQTIFNRPNIVFKICGIKASGDDSTVILVAEDKSTNRRVPAYDLNSALTQPYVKSQMDNLGMVSVSPKVKPSPEQLKRYLENAPDGIDPRVWHQAQEDNPDPTVMIPVSIVGLDALKKKVLWQESENQQHHARLRLIEEDISNLASRYGTMNLELQQLRRRHYETAHRILKVVGRQDSAKKEGFPLQQEEEELKKRLENMDLELNSPTKYKGQIDELMSQIRIHKQKSSIEGRSNKKYLIDSDALAQIKEFLSIQHESTKHLVETTKVDLTNLKRMASGVSELMNKMTKP